MHEAVAITFFVIYALEAVVIIIGNTFTIFVFWTQRPHLKRTCFLLINLAVADLLVGITEPIIIATEKIPRSKAPRRGEQNITNPSNAFQILGSSTSAFFLALISLERVFAVLWPLRHRVMTTRVYIYSILVVWAVGMCLLLPRLITQGLDMAPVTVSELSSRFVSLLIMCASYVKIHNRLRSRAQEFREESGRESTEHNLRLSRTFFIVVALSLVFWLPAFVVYTIHEFCKPCFPPYAIAIVNILHLANSMVNPFVYTFKMPIFKDALKNSLWKRRGIHIRGEHVCRRVLGGRGSFTPQMEHTVRTPDISLTAWRQSTVATEQIQAVGILIDRKPGFSQTLNGKGLVVLDKQLETSKSKTCKFSDTKL